MEAHNFHIVNIIEVGSYFINKELFKGYFLLQKPDIDTLESNTLFKKILLQDITFKEELINILEKEILSGNNIQQ